MKPEIRDAIISKLESGQYEKAFGIMREDDDHFCTHGVICETYREMTGIGRWEYNEDSGEWGFHIPGWNTGYVAGPPVAVMIWAGMNDGEATRIVNWNDGQFGSDFGEALSFSEIAIKMKEEM